MYLFTLGGKQTMDFRDILERYSLNEKILNNFSGKRVPHALKKSLQSFCRLFFDVQK